MATGTTVPFQLMDSKSNVGVTTGRLNVNAQITDASTGTAVSIDDSGQMHVVQEGSVSTDNSTSTPLSAGATFTGSSIETLKFAVITVMVFSDVASATDGLKIEFSTDETNWDSDDVFTVPANTGKTFSFQPQACYVRVRYINGGSDQTAFRLQTIMKKTYVKPSSHRIQDNIIGDDDAELVKSVLTGLSPSGSYLNVNTTDDGYLAISNNSSGLAIAKGDVTGHDSVNKFGNAPDFDTGDGEVDVWDGSDDANAWAKFTYNYSSTADIQYISSTQNADTQTIEVQGLDANYDLVTQTKALTGQTSATLDTALIRVFRLKNVNSTDLTGYVFCSSSAAGAGGIPATADIRAIISVGNNQTEMAIYTVPAGKTGYIREIYASTAGGSRATNYIIKLKISSFGQVFQLKHRRSINDDKDLEKIFDTPEVATEKSDIIITAETTEAAITASSLSAGFDIILVDN